MTAPAAEGRQRLTGIALMCGAVACFACLDSSAKLLSAHMAIMQIAWARYTGAFLLATAVSNPITHPGLLASRRPGLQIIRSVLLLGSTVLNFIALRYLQLAEALAITFATPFLVAVLSGPILGEWVGWRRWTAIGVGFLGVLLVTRPGFGGIHPAAIFSVAASGCYAFYIVTTRLLAQVDSNQTTLFYSNLVGALATLPILPAVWTTPQEPLHIVLMIAAGVLGGAGHYLLIVAHRLAPASVLAPFIYTQLILVGAFGYFIFGDIPNGWTLTGAAIVVASGLYMLYRERKVAKKV